MDFLTAFPYIGILILIIINAILVYRQNIEIDNDDQ